MEYMIGIVIHVLSISLWSAINTILGHVILRKSGVFLPSNASYEISMAAGGTGGALLCVIFLFPHYIWGESSSKLLLCYTLATQAAALLSGGAVGSSVLASALSWKVLPWRLAWVAGAVGLGVTTLIYSSFCGILALLVIFEQKVGQLGNFEGAGRGDQRETPI